MTRIILALILVALAVVAEAAPQSQNVNRGKRIGFKLENQFRQEENDGAGGVVGEYGVRTGDGCLRVTRYKATRRGGFKIISTTKTDCDPTRMVSRLMRPGVPRPKVIKSDPTPKMTKAPIKTKQTPSSTPAPSQLPQLQQQLPQESAKPAATGPEPEVKQPVTTGRPLPKVANKPKQQKKQKKNKPRRNRNRPKQLKKEFDFKGLSKGNPARPLDKKDDPVYSFGFTAPGHGHTQAGLPDGSKKGEYYFDSPDGWRRIVTYEANAKGFFPKMRRIRIPGWTSTTPVPRVSRNKNRGGSTQDGAAPEGGVGNGGEGGEGGAGGSGDGKGGSGGSGGDGGDSDLSGKQLLDSLRNGGTGSCPYYFFYNTKVNFHWERCMENGTKVGQYGLLHEDGFSYRTSYYADTTGYHPKSTKVPLTEEQTTLIHQFTEGVFILPKTDEERRVTEQRILAWLDANRDLLRDPLRG